MSRYPITSRRATRARHAVTLVSAAAACIELGSYREAERALVDAYASAQHMGLTGVSANVWHHQGMLVARLGDPKAGLMQADKAIEAFVAQADRRHGM